MTVRELINSLKDFDPSFEVTTLDSRDYTVKLINHPRYMRVKDSPDKFNKLIVCGPSEGKLTCFIE